MTESLDWTLSHHEAIRRAVTGQYPHGMGELCLDCPFCSEHRTVKRPPPGCCWGNPLHKESLARSLAGTI